MSIKTLRDQEGYFMMDHRHANPVPDQLVVANGLPTGAGRGLFESASFTCKHCQTIVILNPDRSRERAYCRGCDHLICDPCAAEKAITGVCKTFDQRADEFLNTVILP
jgi:hypothetical protein